MISSIMSVSVYHVDRRCQTVVDAIAVLRVPIVNQMLNSKAEVPRVICVDIVSKCNHGLLKTCMGMTLGYC